MSQYGAGQYGMQQWGYSWVAPDWDPPYLANLDPANLSEGIAADKIISLDVLDAWLGVDFATVLIYVEGNLAYTGLTNTFNAPYDEAGSGRTLIPGGARYTIEKATDWDSYENVTVRVVADDLQTPPNHLDTTYSFRVVDYLGPELGAVSPTIGQIAVQVDANITVTITDEQLLANNSILIEVDPGTGYEIAYQEGGAPAFKPGWNGPSSVVSIIPQGVEITVDPLVDFQYGTEVNVRVTAFDVDGNPVRF
jgi:hypothetical protein